jgi:galactonate dehydratase
MAACLQLDFACENALVQADSPGLQQRGASLLESLHPITVTDGRFTPPSGPGLGVSVDHEAVRQRADIDATWQNPRWQHPDGSVADF